MKKLLIIPLLLINGCSSFSLFGDRQACQPQVKPVEVVTVAERPPIYHPPLPEEINSNSVSENFPFLLTSLI